MEKMFGGCTNLQILNLSSFCTSKVTNMIGLFMNCESLMSLDLTNFITSNVGNMESMFSGCKNIKYLDLSNFNTSNVLKMYGMFANCENLISLEITNFNTNKVNNMQEMFFNCKNLTQVTTMQSMFKGCEKLNSLYLSSFNITNETNIENMFNGCNNLIYIDLKNAILSLVTIDNKKFDFPLRIIISINNPNGNIKYFFKYNCTIIEGGNSKINLKYNSDKCYFINGNLYKNGSCYSDSKINICIEKDNDDIINSTNIENKEELTNVQEEKSIPSANLFKDTNFTLEKFFRGECSLEDNKIINLSEEILKGGLSSLLYNIDNENFVKIENNKKYQVSTLSNQNKDKNSSFIDLGNCEYILKRNLKLRIILME